MIIGITGHRPSKLGGYKLPNPTYISICQQLQELLIKYNATKVISGMAIGFDQWAAFVSIKNKIPFIAAIPFLNQECKWQSKDQEIYHKLLLKADDVVIVSDGEYSAFKMQIRNEYIVDNCDLLIAAFDGVEVGGTYNCIQYAKSKSKRIEYLNVIR